MQDERILVTSCDFNLFVYEVKAIKSPCLDREACLTITSIVDSEKTAPYVCLQG